MGLSSIVAEVLLMTTVRHSINRGWRLGIVLTILIAAFLFSGRLLFRSQARSSVGTVGLGLGVQTDFNTAWRIGFRQMSSDALHHPEI
jgi:hypothetical protein